MIEDLVSRVFYARNVAHYEHWKANGIGAYAKHTALGEFYDGVIDAIDALVEAYQGAFDLIGAVKAPKTKATEILAILVEDADWIEKNHESICKGNRAVANLLDSVTGVYLSAIYKLRNLM
jgi:DNA-binding ferritin-like protein